MNYCKECKIKISTKGTRCPICAKEIISLDNNFIEPYPKIPIPEKKRPIWLRALIFVGIILFFFVIAYNFLNPRELVYLSLASFVLSYIWMTIFTIQKSLKNIGYFILKQVILISAIVIGIDYFTGFSLWSINYFIPIILIFGVSAIASIVVYKPMQFREYFIYQITISIIGALGFLLVLFNLSTVSWPLIFSSFYSIIVMLGMFIFADNKSKLELKKRFHI